MAGSETGVRPRIRAITAFLALERARYENQVAATLNRLRQAKRILEDGGYEVETLRITTQPFLQYVRDLSRAEALRFFRNYAQLAGDERFGANIGPAMTRDDGEAAPAELLAEILSENTALSSSLWIGGEAGLYWRSIAAAAKLVKYVEDHSPGSAGNFKFAATAMLEPYAPFFPGSYHLGPGGRFSVAMESVNVVDEVFGETGWNAPKAERLLIERMGRHTSAIESLARRAEHDTGWTYMGVDPTPAPLRDRSIGAAIEKFTGRKFGSSGTMTAASIITRAVKALPVKRVGYAGLMVPVLEDTVLAQRWSESAYGIDSLLAYSAVCGTGLDTIPLPGDITQSQIERMLADVATLAWKWKKPLSARLLPVKGKSAGDRTGFRDPMMVNAVIRPLP